MTAATFVRRNPIFDSVADDGGLEFLVHSLFPLRLSDIYISTEKCHQVLSFSRAVPLPNFNPVWSGGIHNTILGTQRMASQIINGRASRSIMNTPREISCPIPWLAKHVPVYHLVNRWLGWSHLILVRELALLVPREVGVEGSYSSLSDMILVR